LFAIHINNGETQTIEKSLVWGYFRQTTILPQFSKGLQKEKTTFRVFSTQCGMGKLVKVPTFIDQ